uniref:transposase n=1 Tax=Aeromonas caviae TaxID=648 RepID=UPI0020B12A71
MSTSLHPITNWPTYNKSLINRGSLTFWVDAEAMNNWFHHGHHGRRGRSQLYTDQTICTFLMLKGIFNLTLRATQGLLDSLFELMNVPLCAALLIKSVAGWPFPNPLIPLNSLAGEQAYQALSACSSPSRQPG